MNHLVISEKIGNKVHVELRYTTLELVSPLNVGVHSVSSLSPENLQIYMETLEKDEQEHKYRTELQ